MPKTKVQKYTADGCMSMLSDIMQGLSQLQQQCYALSEMMRSAEQAEQDEEAAEAAGSTVAKSRRVVHDVAANPLRFERITPKRLSDEEFVRAIAGRTERE